VHINTARQAKQQVNQLVNPYVSPAAEQLEQKAGVVL
jgi:hypothetical protein